MHRRSTTAVLFAAWLLASAFCFASPCFTASLFAEETTIVAFGDSTTAPRGALNIYADRLAKEFPAGGVPARVINAGVGGHNTNHAAARFQKDVLSRHPNVVIIQFGINDAAVDVWKNPPAKAARVSLEAYQKNLRSFVGALKSRGVRVILMTPNPMRWTPKLRRLYGKPPYDPEKPEGFDVLLFKYAEAVRRLAKRENVTLVDIHAAFEAYGKKPGQKVDDLLLDGMHPNDRGHRLIADLLMAQLVSAGKATGAAKQP